MRGAGRSPPDSIGDGSQLSKRCYFKPILAPILKTLMRVRAVKPHEVMSNQKSNVSSQHLQKGAYDLVERAVNPEMLCRMEPTWHPWF